MADEPTATKRRRPLDVPALGGVTLGIILGGAGREARDVELAGMFWRKEPLKTLNSEQ
ncbi:MAG: hypothetical protein NT023_00570 [Armatimonadetes bacterium]|nr:hypothetical protein [Armatimonadota bacterium]